MSSPFSKNSAPEQSIKRNNFDNSYQNNLTMKFGGLYPFMCKEVIPGDSCDVDMSFGLRFMPTYFPIQTKIKAYCDFFYVRSRNLYDGFKNFYFGTGSYEPFPVLSASESLEQMKTGSLGDYLGIPSTIVGGDSYDTLSPFAAPSIIGSLSGDSIIAYGSGTFYSYVNKSLVGASSLLNISQLVQSDDFLEFNDVFPDYPTSETYRYYKLPLSTSFSGSRLFTIGRVPTANSDRPLGVLVGFPNSTETFSSLFFVDSHVVSLKKIPYLIERDGGLYVLVYSSNGSFSLSDSVFSYLNSASSLVTANRMTLVLVPYKKSSSAESFLPELPSVVPFLTIGSIVGDDIVEASSVLSSFPADLSALPFRAYEQIYNAFYRDERNNPYYVNGEFDPNTFLPTTSGGSDSNKYRIRYRNWEQDFLTTALPSPQYGPAPLVGLTKGGIATFRDSDGTLVSAQLHTAEDGDTVISASTTRSAGVNSTLVNMAATGISINDLRGVNSLQRYLEANYRKGLRYKEQIASHFGVDVSYEELDMPEFLGSVSQMVSVDQINQTSASGSDPLGSYAGQLSAIGSSKHRIRKYFDEPGFLIGIISVVPVPVYSQLLPKFFLKTKDGLDYYKPEFAHLGLQPIKYSEVCPLQAASQGVPLTDTFGYQRAHYDYLQSVDEVHGQFRTTLSHFLLGRVYASVPSLNEDFLLVKPDSLTDIFSVNTVNGVPVDTILGQLHINLTMRRPIPRYAVPRLE